MKPMRCVVSFIAVVCLLYPASFFAAEISDDFSSGSTAAWTFRDLYSGGSAQIVNQQYVVSTGIGAAFRPDLTLGDGTYRVDLANWNTSPPNHSFGVTFRYDNTTVSGYALTLDSDGSPNLSFLKFAGGTLTGSHDGATISTGLNPFNEDYILQVLAQGSTFTGSLYARGTMTLLDTLTWSDPDFTSGYGGLLVADDAVAGGGSPSVVAVTFDNFFVSTEIVPVPEPGTLALLAFGLVAGAALRRRKRS